MQEIIIKFMRDHFERIVFTLIALTIATGLYIYFEALREQLGGVYMMILGLMVNKIRSPKKDDDVKPAE